jgi:hypothetical protein
VYSEYILGLNLDLCIQQTTRILKVTVFWDVAPCSIVKITDVSEVLTASIVRASTGADGAFQTTVVYIVATVRT